MKFFGLTIAAAVATMTAQGVSAQELNKKVASDEYVRVCILWERRPCGVFAPFLYRSYRSDVRTLSSVFVEN